MPKRFDRALILSLVALSGTAASAVADDHPVWLQWFETRWRTMEYRVPDLFMAGYSSVWAPPPCKGADPTSVGYDVFDRFDLGQPGSETAYGTTADFQAFVGEMHQARCLVYVDIILNHNSGRNNSDSFYNAGGYPGFALRIGADFWGDFHDGSTQSHQPNPQGTDPPYNLWEGDLLSLIDIAQEKNYAYIRHPIAAGNPQNIPAGTVRNKPDANNRRFYPDLQLTPQTFVNNRLPPGQQSVTIYPYNTTDPMQGDPVTENATGLLVRSVQWLLDVHRVDGFRLDAAKHIPQWFWDQYFDSSVFQRRKTFGGSYVTPFSFGEIVESNAFTATYTRKDGFGNRDALDLNGAGQLRDIRAARGVGSWQNVLSSHLDNQDDGFNNGSLGVTHVYSHDNGSTGNGSSIPSMPTADLYALPQHCYVLFRPGPPVVYYNSRQFADLYQFRGFWPREGLPIALGTEGSGTNSAATRLVQISNGYARGGFYPLNGTDPVNQSNAEVLVFERARDNGGGNKVANVLVGVNDSYNSGVEFRSVQTSFPSGTRLHELTGNHADAVIDPNNVIPATLVVDGNQRVLLPVPNNKSVNGIEHHKGYVVYGPAAPSGMLEVLDGSGSALATALPADPGSVPAYRRRLTPIPIVTDPTFQISLTTSKTDPSDPSWDDNAFFRIDGGYPSAGGFSDFNGNGGPDIPESDAYLPLYENFLTQKAPLATTPGATNGFYRQVINSDALREGIHYIKVIAFRQRPSNTDPIYTEFRQVVYIDRQPPSVTLVDAAAPIATPINAFRILAADRTISNVYLMLDLPMGTDPYTQIGPSTQATQYDRLEWRRTISGLSFGNHTVTIVAYETSGRSSVTTYNVNVTVGSGDVDQDTRITLDDLYAAYSLFFGPVQPPAYNAAADVNGDGQFNLTDLRTLESLLRPSEPQNMSVPQR